jgi:hypothetical protein
MNDRIHQTASALSAFLMAAVMLLGLSVGFNGSALLGDEPTAEVLEARIKEPAGAKITIDGRLDEPAWSEAPELELRDRVTGEAPKATTGFRAFWKDNALYLAVRANLLADAARGPQKPVIGATKHDDQAIWNGDVVELLLQTQTHGYYELAVNAAGALVDLDRKGGIQTAWESGAQVATQTDGAGWTVEMRIPFAGDTQTDLDPLKGVAGSRPSATSPCYFNVCRQYLGPNGTEYSAFVPTGKADFQVPEKFGKMVVWCVRCF